MPQMEGLLREQVQSPVRVTSGGAQLRHWGASCRDLTASGVGGRLRWPQCLLDCWLVHSCFLEKSSVPLTPDPSSFTILRALLSPFPSGCEFEGQAVHGWSQEMEDRSCQTRFRSFSPLRASSQICHARAHPITIFLEPNQLPVLREQIHSLWYHVL